VSEGVARYVQFTAQPGRGEELAARLLRAADSLKDTPGCELYVVNRSAADPDQVWVTELWRDQEALDGSLEQLKPEPGSVTSACGRACARRSATVTITPRRCSWCSPGAEG
jgi:quinol monooxygenase YgiN